MPSTAGVTIGLPPARAALEAVQRSVRLRRAYTISNAQKQETRWGAAFPGNIGPMLMIGVTGSPFGATAARFSRHLPVTSQHLLLSDRLLASWLQHPCTGRTRPSPHDVQRSTRR